MYAKKIVSVVPIFNQFVLLFQVSISFVHHPNSRPRRFYFVGPFKFRKFQKCNNFVKQMDPLVFRAPTLRLVSRQTLVGQIPCSHFVLLVGGVCCLLSSTLETTNVGPLVFQIDVHVRLLFFLKFFQPLRAY